MKKCLQCEQVYGDETNFCLSDGAALVGVSGSFAPTGETPTVYGGSPAPTGFGNAPFTAPAASAAPPSSPKSRTLLIAAAAGIFALVAGGALLGLAIYGLNSAGKKDANDAVNSDDKSNKNASRRSDSNDVDAAENLRKERENLDRERRKLDEERRRLEARKKESAPMATPSGAQTAVIVDPPSNIRAAPNGAVLCVARSRGTIVSILGSTGVTDNNGTWYYTDYCGSRGVIHSTQIKF